MRFSKPINVYIHFTAMVDLLFATYNALWMWQKMARFVCLPEFPFEFSSDKNINSRNPNKTNANNFATVCANTHTHTPRHITYRNLMGIMSTHIHFLICFVLSFFFSHDSGFSEFTIFVGLAILDCDSNFNFFFVFGIIQNVIRSSSHSSHRSGLKNIRTHRIDMCMFTAKCQSNRVWNKTRV